jgi:hypothetical protein
MEEKDNLEEICSRHLSGNPEIYRALNNFIFLTIPVEPEKPYQIACDATILKNFMGGSSIKYRMAGFVALLNGDYSEAEQHIKDYVKQAGLDEANASKYAVILANKEKVHDILQEYFKPQLEKIKKNVVIEEAISHKAVDKNKKEC